MFRWLLTIVFTVLALRRMTGTRSRVKPTPRPPFDPEGPLDRANSRAGEALSSYAIEDAEYEEIPGTRR